MDYTSYGAGGGDGAGGFVQGGHTDEAVKKRDYSNDNLRPVTIKQLFAAHVPTAGADHFMVDGHETTQITFVGQIRNRSFQHLNHVYRMDDGTGLIEVKLWVDSDTQEDQDNPLQQLKEKLQENTYARVFGQLREINNKRHVHSRIIRPVTDPNEIQYHMLEATYVHLLATRGAPGDAQKNGANGQSNGGYGGYGDSNERAVPASASTNAKKVFACIKNTPQQNEGLHAQMIASRTNLDVSDVMRASDELVSHGLIYTTVDEHTWAILDV